MHFCAPPLASFAQAVSLDSTFGDNGISTFAMNGRAMASAIQADGKVVIGGYRAISNNPVFAVLRYNVNGSLDSTFGADGVVTTSFGAGSAVLNGIAIQADGKIVAAGSATSNARYMAIARYNTDGSLDSTFNATGKVVTDIAGSDDVANGIVIQTNGKIVVGGYSHDATKRNFALLRYNTNGSLDSTFNADGIAITSIGTADDNAKAIALQTDGKIVLAGYCRVGTKVHFALARYSSNGSLDNTFDTDGMLTTAIGTSNNYLSAMALQGDGKIVVAGMTDDAGSFGYSFALARYNSDGSLDNSFNANGKVVTKLSATLSQAYAIAIQPDGKILAAGYKDTNSLNVVMVLVRYNTDGSLDMSFNDNGQVVPPLGNEDDEAESLSLQADGKIIMAGTTRVGTEYHFAVLRYNNDIGTANSPIFQQVEMLKIYPNPFTLKSTFETNATFTSATLKVFNMQGQLVKETKNLSCNKIFFDQGSIQAGMYYLQLLETDKTIASGKIVIGY